MMASPIVAAVAAVARARSATRAALAVAAPFLLLWFVAPGVAYWLSLPIGARARPLDDRQRLLLRRTARKTWRYFDTFVTEADAWLPPDNYQEEGDAPRLARRTSPTNIAMGLLSTLAAHDLGYLSTRALADRLDRTLTTLEGLERHEGHFLNWYDTATLAPLHPRYVSTVDSGNLAGRADRARAGPVGARRRAADLRAAARRAGRHGRAPVRRRRPRAPARRRSGSAVTRVNEVARAIVGRGAARRHADARPAQLEALGRGSRRGHRERSRTQRPPDDARRHRRTGVRRRSTRFATLAGEPDVPADVLAERSRAARSRSPTRCDSSSCTTGAGASSRSAIGSPTPRVRAASTRRSTTCSPPRRGWRASSRSPRATCRSITGSTSAGSSRTSTAARR